jgi:hypothetical protein
MVGASASPGTWAPSRCGFGPNGVRHLDQSLEAVSALPISLAEKLDIVGTVDQYVFGCCLQDRDNGQGDELGNAGMAGYLGSLLATGDYPQLTALVTAHGLDQAWALMRAYYADDGRLERNLGRVLDGIEAGLPR